MRTIHTSGMSMLITWIFVLSSCKINAQQVHVLDSGRQVSLRGLSVVNDEVFWVSGSKGTVGVSVDGGKQIKWLKATEGYEERDFRDIEAFDAKTAIIMAVDTPAVILKTKDGGNTWKKVFEDKRPGMFLDAMFFKNKKTGIIVGDPVDGDFFIALTLDKGEHWKIISSENTITPEKGEALFAASGTNAIIPDQNLCFVTGGLYSHLIEGNKKISLPMSNGKSTSGANSIAAAEDGRMIIVGGDFTTDSLSEGNCIITDNSGKTFIKPTAGPYGYKSCIVYSGNKVWISCGTKGIDISTDHGTNWKHLSDQSFHVVQKAKKGNRIYLAGNKGIIAVLNFPEHEKNHP